MEIPRMLRIYERPRALDQTVRKQNTFCDCLESKLTKGYLQKWIFGRKKNILADCKMPFVTNFVSQDTKMYGDATVRQQLKNYTF